MTGCVKGEKFIITDYGHIELRNSNGEYIRSIACKKCIKNLEVAIKKFKKRKRFKRREQT